MHYPLNTEVETVWQRSTMTSFTAMFGLRRVALNTRCTVARNVPGMIQVPWTAFPYKPGYILACGLTRSPSVDQGDGAQELAPAGGILCRLERIESSRRNIYAPKFDVAISWDGRLPFEQRLPPGEACATFTCHGKWTRQLASVLTWSNASILCRGRHRGV